MSNFILKPCPFCGGKAELHTTAYASRAKSFVHCEKCSAKTDNFIDLTHDGSYIFNAIADWNKRVVEDQ